MSHVDRDKCSYEVNSKKINDITPVKLEGADLVNYCTRLNDYNYDPDGKKHPKSDFSKLSTENGEKKRYTPPENLCQCKSALGDKFDYDPSRSQGGKKRKTKKTRKSRKSRKKTQRGRKYKKGGKEDFGTYKDGSSVFKDKNGYYIDEWDNDKQVIYKKYLKSWKPVISDTRLILDKKTKKWKIVKSKKTKTMKKSSKKTKTSRCPNGTRKNKKSGKCEKK